MGIIVCLITLLFWGIFVVSVTQHAVTSLTNKYFRFTSRIVMIVLPIAAIIAAIVVFDLILPHELILPEPEGNYSFFDVLKIRVTQINLGFNQEALSVFFIIPILMMVLFTVIVIAYELPLKKYRNTISEPRLPMSVCWIIIFLIPMVFPMFKEITVILNEREEKTFYIYTFMEHFKEATNSYMETNDSENGFEVIGLLGVVFTYFVIPLAAALGIMFCKPKNHMRINFIALAGYVSGMIICNIMFQSYIDINIYGLTIADYMAASIGAWLPGFVVIFMSAWLTVATQFFSYEKGFKSNANMQAVTSNIENIQ